MSYITLENVRKQYKLGEVVVDALRGVTFGIDEGDFTVIVGPSGALDYNTGKDVLRLLQSTCRDKGMTAIVITHNQAIAPIADKVISIKNGVNDLMRINPEPTPIEEIEW